MGEVWRARDTKLGREVAIKTLPEEFAKDADRLARFEREAKLLASLNHPNIAAIYGLEEHEGTRFLVLELVEGPTLGDRTKQGAVPVEESLKLALQISEALEAAHGKGVIHRDLKPDNIKVTPDGKVKVLDFGLAKGFEGDVADASVSMSPTLSMQATQQGVILGTASYMSPEQASGETTDKRADIWSFGVVLFEMLTGQQVFTGKNVSHILADVLRADPEWNHLPPNLHPRLWMLLERCLEKEAKDRCHDISDVRVDIQKVLSDPDGVWAQSAIVVGSNRSLAASLLVVAAVAVLAATISGVAVWNARAPADVRRAVHMTITLPENEQLAGGGLEEMSPVAASVNGDIAYVGMRDEVQQLFLRRLDSREATPIRGSEGATGPFFSPDGQSIGFFAASRLKTVSIDGGVPRELARSSVHRGGTWGDDGYIIYSIDGGGNGLLRIADSGAGEPEPVTIPDPESGEGSHRFPQILPGGEAIIYTVGTGGSWDDALIVAQRLDSGERFDLVTGSDARYVRTGHLVYVRAGRLMAVPFNLERLDVTGEPVPLVEGIMQATDITGASFVAVSGTETGELVFVPGAFQATDRRLIWIDPAGPTEPLSIPSGPYNRLSLSPDGLRVAVEIDQGDEQQIWIHDVQRANVLTPLPLEGIHNQAPTITPDGASVSFTRGPFSAGGSRSLFSTLIDGSAEPQLLLASEDGPFWSTWSTDGQILVFSVQKPDNQWDIQYMRPGSEDTPQPYLASDGNQMKPLLSLDDSVLAFSSDELGRQEIYVRSFPDLAQGRQLISAGGVTDHGFAWAREGRRLFYLTGHRMIAVDIETEPELAIGRAR